MLDIVINISAWDGEEEYELRCTAVILSSSWLEIWTDEDFFISGPDHSLVEPGVILVLVKRAVISFGSFLPE